MRMTLNKPSQLALVAGVSLLAAGLMTACGTLTVDFVYVSSAKAAGPNNYGEIDVFEVNSESGRMRQIPTSPFPSGGRNPVAEVVAPDNANLYVVNEDDNTIVQFVIGNDGKLYPQNTVNTPGVFPMATATGGGFLFVADTYQPLPACSTASPCSGSVAVFPIGSNDVLGSAVENTSVSGSYWPLSLPGNPTHVMVPTAVATAASGAYVYVSAYDATTTGGYIFGFAVNTDGTLSALNGGAPFAAGGHPSAMAASPDGSLLYVTDFKNNKVLVYSLASGALTQIGGSPFPSGTSPSAIVVDGTGKWVYVANSQDSNVTAYSSAAGVLSSVGVYTTGTQPVAIGIDPGLNQYLYTANFLDSSVSGFQIQPADGTLLHSQFSSYAANLNPTAVAAIPHGSAIKK